MKKLSLLTIPFIAVATYAQDAETEVNTDVAYVNPSAAFTSGNVKWSDIQWTDADGVARTTPISSTTDVYISGNRASNYWHPVVEAGSNISINMLTLDVSGSTRNDLKTLEINGTAESPVALTVADKFTFAQNFTSVSATNTTFSAGETKISYLSKLSFTGSNVTLGKVYNGNVASLEFNSTTATTGSVELGHTSNISIVNNSDVTTGGWYMQNPTLTVTDSKFTVAENTGLVTSNTLTMNLTNAEVDVDLGIRNSSGPLTLNMSNSSLLIRKGAYDNAAADALYMGQADQKATVILSNSTITTTKGVSFGTSTDSVLTFLNLNAEETAITCSKLTFAGTLIVDFAGSNITQDTVFTLISAENASEVFDNLAKVEIKGLKEGESIEWLTDDLSTVAISFIAVPEPSTYAAIFGALALAFVAYRKKRS